MRAAESWHKYILLAEDGVMAAGEPASLLGQLPQPKSMESPESVSLGAADGREVTVIDTVHPEGPRLVEADAEIAAAVNGAAAPLRMEPLVKFAAPDPRLRAYGGAEPGEGGVGVVPAPAVQVKITCVDADTGAGIEGARVVAFTDFAAAHGGEGTTNASGVVVIKLAKTAIERLYVYAPESGLAYWGAFQFSVDGSAPVTVPLTPVDLTYVDGVRYYYGNSNFDAERGVVAGVIDTGAGPHDDLNLIGGINTVTGEPAGEYSDPQGHGTHVSGLIGSAGTPPSGLRGLAPGVNLRAYRVFPQPPEPGVETYASNWAIMKALLQATADECDLVNLSLGGGPHNPVIEKAVGHARDHGVLVVIAAGNEYRSPASFPSAYPRATAVTAMGRRGTFPAGSVDDGSVAQKPEGTDSKEFLADFSNVGQEVTVTAPGVGDLSTLPGNRFGPLSGTSMAAPVACGAVACLLSLDASVYGMARDGSRSQAIEALLTANCRSLAFGEIYEGKGMPDPATV